MSEIKLLKIEVTHTKDGMKVETFTTERFQNIVEETKTERELTKAIKEIDTIINKYLENI